MSEIEIVPTKEQTEDQKDDNIIELRNQLIQEESELFPLTQEVNERRYRIGQLKLRIQNINSKYWLGRTI